VKNNQIFYGIALSIGLAALAALVHFFTGFAGVEVYALLFGLLLANIIKMPAFFAPGIQFSEKKILGWAVALMGLQLNFSKLNLSWWLVPTLILTALVAIFLGRKLAQRFGMYQSCGFMMGVGQAICGASAIAAVAPLLKTRAHETGVAVGVVNILGTLGMIGMPLFVLLLGFSPQESGTLIGGTLQAVGQVVAAGYAVDAETGEVATLVKMGRVLMLGPLVVITAFVVRGKGSKIDAKKVLPSFIIAFIVLLVLANVGVVPDAVLGFAKSTNKWLLSIAMAAIGMQIRFTDLRKQGPKALLLGSIIFVVQIALIIAFIYGQRLF